MSIHNSSLRLPYLDFLRGIAVLGLLTMNLPSMGLLFETTAPANNVLFDQAANFIRSMLLDARFRSLFSLLFGIGLYLQYKSYKRQQLNPRLILKTRLNWLLLFGLVHCLFIWFGDILITYALCGYLVIRRLDESPRKMLKRGCIYFTLGFFIFYLFTHIDFFTDEESTSLYQDGVFTPELLSISELYFMNVIMTFMNFIIFPFLSLLPFCGLMYIGIALFRCGVLKKGFSPKSVWFLTIVTLIFSLLDFCGLDAERQMLIVPGVFATVSGLSMALLIWHWTLISNISNSETVIICAIKSVGRRALSFYILQSLTMTTLLRFVFPEWNSELSYIQFIFIAIAFIPVQLILAHYYQKRFKQGPLEYFWRKRVLKKQLKLSA